jgi:hypothetical protein
MAAFVIDYSLLTIHHSALGIAVKVAKTRNNYSIEKINNYYI